MLKRGSSNLQIVLNGHHVTCFLVDNSAVKRQAAATLNPLHEIGHE